MLGVSCPLSLRPSPAGTELLGLLSVGTPSPREIWGAAGVGAVTPALDFPYPWLRVSTPFLEFSSGLSSPGATSHIVIALEEPLDQGPVVLGTGQTHSGSRAKT